MMEADPTQARRIELIVSQLESLPTLGSVAVRLLELTAADDVSVREVVELISVDPALSGKVIRLCRCSDRGRAHRVSTIDRAVSLLGFEAVRTAALSVQVLDALAGLTSLGGEARPTRTTFDPDMFWQHSLAVAV
ncbi:MAG: HDOD domain-containing protein, partial [Gemmatimonadetes bacterium]|nr:HDOD domain-containing protein [Gemmatimonadota bacterium]